MSKARVLTKEQDAVLEALGEVFGQLQGMGEGPAANVVRKAAEDVRLHLERRDFASKMMALAEEKREEEEAKARELEDWRAKAPERAAQAAREAKERVVDIFGRTARDYGA